MARRYSFAPAAQTPGGAKSLATIMSGTNWPVKLKQIEISNPDVAGATNIEVRVTRLTAGGTGTATAPGPHMTDDLAFTGVCKAILTVEPTKTTVLFRKRWNLITDFLLDCEAEKLEFVAMAGAGDGFAVEILADSGANTLVVVTFDEGA